MKHTKRLSLVLTLLIFLGSVAFSQIKVACVGNSITFGYGIDDRDHGSYPVQLQNMLGNEWEVRNFGNSGSTLLRNGDRPYWNQKEFYTSKAFDPDVVVIMLGTNDTKPQNWKNKDQFISDYTAMINEYKALPSKPFIIVCIPVPAYSGRWEISDSIIRADLTPMIKTIAKKNHVQMINLYIPLSNHSELFPDGIHPNAQGAGIMAKFISGDLLKWEKKILKRKK